ncbi:MAG: hypothetical protein M3Z54_07575 [Gemmatimonadota bacterium]|nr:hypothetical protein [Gemmatimonadota bacterium]
MIGLHESRQERKAKFYSKFNADFGERIRDATAVFEAQRGSKLTRTELAAILRKRTGKPITTRFVGRWYRGLGAPRGIDLPVQLATILNVRVGWLIWGEAERELPSRGVYIGVDHLSFYDNAGVYIGEIKVKDPEDQVVINKCWGLLDLVSPLRPALSLERGSKSG